jgi:Cu/Ag efflux pump CusA
MVWFIRGRIVGEEGNPISRFLVWLYRPVVRWALNLRWLTLLLALMVLAMTWYPFSRIGSEFMPPLEVRPLPAGRRPGGRWSIQQARIRPPEALQGTGRTGESGPRGGPKADGDQRDQG